VYENKKTATRHIFYSSPQQRGDTEYETKWYYKVLQCENATTIQNTAFVTLSSFSVGEIERLSGLLSIYATNIPPILPQSAVAKIPSSWVNSPRKIFLKLGDEADKQRRNVGKRKYQHTVRNIPEEQRPPKRWFFACSLVNALTSQLSSVETSTILNVKTFCFPCSNSTYKVLPDHSAYKCHTATLNPQQNSFSSQVLHCEC